MAQPQSVELVADKLPRADAFGQVPDADLVGQGVERASHLLIRGEPNFAPEQPNTTPTANG